MKRKEKIREFKKMGKGELLKTLTQKREKLRQLRFDKEAGKVKNVKEIKEIKKDIARILTILKSKT